MGKFYPFEKAGNSLNFIYIQLMHYPLTEYGSQKMHSQLNINLQYDPQMKENSLLNCSRYVSVFKESICIFKLLYNVVWESTICNWWPAPKMLETSEGYGRWEWSWRGCCLYTGYCCRFGSTTYFSVSVTKLSIVSVYKYSILKT